MIKHHSTNKTISGRSSIELGIPAVTTTIEKKKIIKQQDNNIHNTNFSPFAFIKWREGTRYDMHE